MGNTESGRRAAEVERAQFEQVLTADRLGLRIVGTDALAVLQEAQDRSLADLRAAALKVSVLDPDGWKQRDASGRFERPSVWLEIYWAALDRAARISRDCVALGIAAMSADVMRRDAEQVTGLLQALIHALGMRWDAPEVQGALVKAIGSLEAA
jgi:hypothetical protein